MQPLYQALRAYPPFNRLVNETMLAAVSLSELPSVVFESSATPEAAEKAIGVLLALGSRAREKAGEASLSALPNTFVFSRSARFCGSA